MAERKNVIVNLHSSTNHNVTQHVLFVVDKDELDKIIELLDFYPNRHFYISKKRPPFLIYDDSIEEIEEYGVYHVIDSDYSSDDY